MNLTKIRYFLEVADCGSFSGAAQRLYTTQPNISKQIAQMEQELDFPLFVRNRRTVQLTAAGRLLYEQLQGLPDKLDAIFEEARELSRRENSVLRIGILEGQEVRAQLLYRLNLARELTDNLELELERSSFANLRSGLKDGHYDLIVTLDFDVEQEPDFAARRLYAQAPAIAINRNHPLASTEKLSMSQLKDENFVVIAPQESQAGYERFISECQETGFTPRVVRQPRTLESLILCVELGVGVALLDQNARLGQDSMVRTIPIPGRDMYVVAAYLRSDYRPVLQSVLRLLSKDGL